MLLKNLDRPHAFCKLKLIGGTLVYIRKKVRWIHPLKYFAKRN